MHAFSMDGKELLEARRWITALPQRTRPIPESRSGGIFGWFLLVLLLLALILLLHNQQSGPAPAATAGEEGANSSYLAFVLALLGLSVAWLGVTNAVLHRWLRQDEAKKPQVQTQVTWSAAGLCFITQVYSRSFEWAAFVAFAETPEFLLFEQRESLWQIIAKRAFADQQELQQFRLFAAEHVPLRANTV
jgi:hypothetical protein